MLAQEWLGLKTGWSSRELCHHCRVTHTAYAVAPSLLHELPRRSLDEIVNSCAHPGIPSIPAFIKKLCLVTFNHSLGPTSMINLFLIISSKHTAVSRTVPRPTLQASCCIGKHLQMVLYACYQPGCGFVVGGIDLQAGLARLPRGMGERR